MSGSLSTLLLRWYEGPGGQGPGSTSPYNAPKTHCVYGRACCSESVSLGPPSASAFAPIFVVQEGIKQEAAQGQILWGFRRGVGADNSENSSVKTELRVAAGRGEARSGPLSVLEPDLPALARTASTVVNH